MKVFSKSKQIMKWITVRCKVHCPNHGKPTEVMDPTPPNF